MVFPFHRSFVRFRRRPTTAYYFYNSNTPIFFACDPAATLDPYPYDKSLCYLESISL